MNTAHLHPDMFIEEVRVTKHRRCGFAREHECADAHSVADTAVAHWRWNGEDLVERPLDQ